ncbi:hypothetical protein OsJ_36122 [Oryza sativa Japonica Group]|uniref:Large ribosomal subunit protein uL4m n=1 Tax=Oryza sativa subsp. japonica TaxID=39947 RepID=B9GD67_ORYSJ|nr:hypothetical protein OsJ_36122 [Oryza sativa Japonica Group]
MRALPRGAAASLLRAAAAAAPCRPRPVQLQRRLPDADRLLAMVRVLPPFPHPLHSSSDPSCVGCPILCGILIAVCLQPYKQKGTGRARHGTLRGPQFRGGATMHGPKPRSHAIKLQKKVRRLGLKIALSARTAEGKLLVFEDLEVPSHKTKNVVSYISQMEDTKKVLLVDGGDIDKKLKLATQNLHYVNVLPSIGLNVYSILQHDTLVMTRDAVNRIVERMHTPINR